MSTASVAGAAAFLLAAGGLPAGAMLAPRTGQPVAILHRAADGGAAAQAVAIAGGSLLRSEGRHVTVAMSDAADFASRVQMSGAWIVVDAAALGACDALERAGSTVSSRIRTKD